MMIGALRLVGSVTLLAWMMLGGVAGAAPTTDATAVNTAPPPPRESPADRAPSPPARTAPSAGSPEKPRGLLERARSRWDYVAVGGGGAYVFNAFIHLLTYHWRHVRLTAMELMCTFNNLEVSLDWHLGPTAGFGGFQRTRGRFSLSHWFVTGVWFGQMHPISFADVQNTYRGIFLMAGYELRLHFGRRLDWLFGVRVFGVASPLGENQLGPCTCHEGDWFCTCEPDPDDRIRYPLTFGVSAFFGY